MRIAALFRYMNTCRIYVYRDLLSVCPCTFAIYKPHRCTFINECMRYCQRRSFEIVYAQNFISSLAIKQMIHLIYFHNPLLFMKCNLYRQKLHDPPHTFDLKYVSCINLPMLLFLCDVTVNIS